MADRAPRYDRTTIFQQHTTRLYGLAYRMLGSRADAEDVLQEAYLRWHQATTEGVQTPEAWLVTTVTRLCIDRLRARRAVRGAERLTRFVLGIARLFRGRATYHVAPINGEVGLMIRLEGRLHSVLSIDTDGTRVLVVYNVLNPQKLRGMVLPEPHAP